MSSGFIPDRDSSGNIIQQQSPFSAKVIKDGKLFRRLHGSTFTLNASGDTVHEITVPYLKCKINKLELLWFPEGVTVDFEVLDTEDCAIQIAMGVPEQDRVPNAMLNQFSFGAGIRTNYHEDTSEYDADLIQDMKIRITLHNPTIVTKTVCINSVFHEIK